jgi:hypothetical protein
MGNILLFESFVDRIYELRYNDRHYHERTSLTHPESRIVPYSINYPYGFIIENFLDENQRLEDPDFIEDFLGIDSDTANNYISKTLHLLTNNTRLDDYNPPTDKQFQMADLGKICFKYYNEKYYPIIAGGRGRNEEGFYDGGEKIWLIIREGDKAITVKYCTDTFDGRLNMTRDFARDVGISPNEFKEISAYCQPYNKKFEVVIDVTDDDPEEVVMERVKNQILGT